MFLEAKGKVQELESGLLSCLNLKLAAQEGN